MTDPTRDEFIDALRRSGLDPTAQDLNAMYPAWIKLRQLMQRLRDPAREPDTQPQSTFDMTRLKNTSKQPVQKPQSLQSQADSDPEQIHQLYDDWANAYDADLKSWGYDAPIEAVTRLMETVPVTASVLDVGCGTGLVGRALTAAGFADVTGIDFSADSLRLAHAAGSYNRLEQVDLTQLPTTLPDAAFGALVCIGVMSYLPDVEGTCREFCRVLKSGSGIVLTQRSDLFDSRHTQRAFDTLSAERLWEQIEVTDQRDYLPGNPDFKALGVRYCVFKTLR